MTAHDNHLPHDAEGYFQAFFLNNPRPMWLYAPDTLEFLAVNDAALAQYGYTREEFLALSVRDIRPAEDVAKFQQFVGRLGQDGISCSGRWRHRIRDGSLIDVEVTSHGFTFGGRVARLVVVEDVTSRVRAEEALRASETELRALIRAISDVILVIDRDGRYLKIHSSGGGRLVRPAPELIGKRFHDLFPPHRADTFLRTVHTALEQNAPIELEYNLEVNGDTLWFAARVSPLLDDQVVWVARDITQRRRAEEALRASERRSQILASATNDAIWDWDLDTDQIEWNEGLETLFGYSREEVGTDASWRVDRLHPEDRSRVLGSLHEVIDLGGQVWSCEYRFRRRDGTYAVVLDRGHVLRAAGRPVKMIGGMTDMSAHRALQEQLRHAQRLQAIGRLAGGVAHDFNNLLTAILSYSDLILSDLPPGNPLRDDIEQIRQAGDRAARLTRQLLAFSRQQILKPQPLRMEAVMAGINKFLRRLIDEDIELAIDLAPDIGIIFADPGQLDQVILNLAVNARDAMPNGGTLTIRGSNVTVDEPTAACLRHICPGEYVVLEVRDTGVGIDPEVQAHIFEPFFTTKSQDQGTGLGLAMVYGIVKQSGGNILVNSSPGVGTTFTIYLPRIHQLPVAREDGGGPPAPRGAAETILLVEDDGLVRQLAREVLVRHGYRVLEANDGIAGLALWESEGSVVDLLITDVVMPKLNGRQLAERLRTNRTDLPVLYISGYTEDAILRRGALTEGSDLLVKPFTPKALTHKVREMLDRAHPPAAAS